jgi:hypothetical protein
MAHYLVDNHHHAHYYECMSTQREFDKGDQVQILIGGPHDHIGRIATVSRIQHDGGVVIYFGDQDEDEWVYLPHELAKAPQELVERGLKLAKLTRQDALSALARVQELLTKWENAAELGTGHPSYVLKAAATEVRKALEGK